MSGVLASESRGAEHFLRATLDSLDANIAVLDERGTILAVNAAWEAFARENGMPQGWTGVGESYLEVCDRASGPDSDEAEAAALGIRQALKPPPEPFLLDYPCHGPGEERWFQMRVTRFEERGRARVVVAHENVTPRKRAEQAIRRSERLASIGTLAAGIAHEINNPLGALLLAARAAQRHRGDPARVEELLDRIVGSARRCNGIVDSLLRCVQSRPGPRALVDPNDSLRAVAELLRPWAEQHGVELRLDLELTLPPISAVVEDLRLALFNLGANAIQSCESGGRVVFESRRAGERVEIGVFDNGRGMSDEERAHAFDPFYSRRVGDPGTGLGLTLCHTIVTDHAGRIEVESQPGAGTHVSLDLPAA